MIGTPMRRTATEVYSACLRPSQSTGSVERTVKRRSWLTG